MIMVMLSDGFQALSSLDALSMLEVFYWPNVFDGISMVSFSSCYPLTHSTCPPTTADAAFVVSSSDQTALIPRVPVLMTGSSLPVIRHLNLSINSRPFYYIIITASRCQYAGI